MSLDTPGWPLFVYISKPLKICKIASNTVFSLYRMRKPPEKVTIS